MKNIILLHGALGTSEDLEALSNALTNEGLQVYAFSFSGHAKTGFNPAFGIEQFAEELKRFIYEKELKNVTVFGYSMGGFVALYLASKEKKIIEKIVTLGTKFNWSKESVDKETKMLDPGTVLEKVPAFAKSLNAKHGEQWKELMQKTAAMMHGIGEKNLLNHEELKTLSLPVLLGIADKDQMVTLEETSTAFKAIPGAAMYMLPGSRHQVESADPNLLSKIILNFINKDQAVKL